MPPTALITGAGAGIGRALAKLLAQEGYGIAALDRQEAGLRSLADELQAAGKVIAWAVADVTDPDGLAAATRELEAKLGPIELLVANAGIGLETTGRAYSTGDMNQVLNVNLLGVSNSIGAVLPGMIERKRGQVAAISSVASNRGLPRMLAYCASKAGVNAIMDGLRVEVAPLGIHFTTICPGWVRTALTEKVQGRVDFMVEPEEAAREIAYAIRTKKIHYTFPRPMRWRFWFLMMLPRSWQDRWITRMMHQIDLVKEK